jgi:hypothetical protein
MDGLNAWVNGDRGDVGTDRDLDGENEDLRKEVVTVVRWE